QDGRNAEQRQRDGRRLEANTDANDHHHDKEHEDRDSPSQTTEHGGDERWNRPSRDEDTKRHGDEYRADNWYDTDQERFPRSRRKLVFRVLHEAQHLHELIDHAAPPLANCTTWSRFIAGL